MKKFFKIIPAALAVFALASCSNDELLGEKAQQVQDVANKGDLRLSVEAFDNQGGTRAMRDNNFGTLTFVEGDVVNVYSEDLYNTDWYSFQGDAFYYGNDDAEMVSEPKYGVLPGGDPDDARLANLPVVRKAYIDRASRMTRVDVEIPEVLVYNAESEAKNEAGNNLYACNLPAFGYASKNAAGYVEVKNLRYMTAILKLDLEKVVSNASWLMIVNYGQDGTVAVPGQAGLTTNQIMNGIYAEGNTSWKPLSGQLTAILYPEESMRKETKLEVLDDQLPIKPYMLVDLREVSSNESHIYIPIIPGLDGDVDNIRLYYSKDRDDWQDATWEEIPGMQFAGTTFKQHSRYSEDYAFEFADMTPNLVTAILSQYKATNDDIVIDITNSFTIDDEESGTDIILPKFDNNVNVTINLAETFGDGGEGSGWNNEETLSLNIYNENPDEPFEGTITINAGEKGATIIEGQPISVNLPEAEAVIAGAFENGATLEPVSGKISIGDGETTTSGISWEGIGEGVKSMTIAKEAVAASDIDFSGNTVDGEIDITVDGELNANITGSPAKNEKTKCVITITGYVGPERAATRGTRMPEANSISAAEGGIWTDLTISGAGQVVGNIEFDDAVKGTIEITAANAENADYTVVTGNVAMKGDVIVAMTSEGEAINGELSMTGSKKTLTLKQGYINTINVNVVNAGSWEDKYINVVLNDDDEGFAAFQALNQNEGAAIFTESVWNGEYATNATYVNTFATVNNSGRYIFTATQLARTAKYASDSKLANNIDLKSNAFTGVKKGGNFEGVKIAATENGKLVKDESKLKYPTIKNLKFEAGNNGLFSEISEGASEISNITIDGVTASLTVTAANIGAFAGIASQDVTFEDVEVKNFAIASTTKALSNVGGFIGKATAVLEATNCKISGTSSIDGYRCLGGFVGTTNKAATFDKCDASAITFKQTWTSAKEMDIDYAKIGGFVGNVSSTAAVTITDGVAPESLNFDKTSKMYVSDTSESTGNFYKFESRQTFIGFSGVYKIGSREATHIGASFINGAGYCAEAGYGTSKAAGNDGHLHGTTSFTYLYTWPVK